MCFHYFPVPFIPICFCCLFCVWHFGPLIN
jgi:hypothetical protein